MRLLLLRWLLGASGAHLCCSREQTSALDAAVGTTTTPVMTSTVAAATAADLHLAGGATVVANPLLSLRSGEPHEHSMATFAVPLSAGVTLTGVKFSYRYTSGFSGGNGTNFSVIMGGTTVYRSPNLVEYAYSKTHPNFSTSVNVTVPGLAVEVTAAQSHIAIVFANNDRNVQLLLPLRLTLTCTGGPCVARPVLPSFIDSNMVLQRAPAHSVIWGHNAAAGETVSVQLDHAAPWSATVAANGQWKVSLAPQAASTGHNLAINFSLSPSHDRVLTNVAFGDVYLCSGQSNMEFSLNHAFNASEEIADSDRYPDLRMFTAAHAVFNTPQFDVADKQGDVGVFMNSSWAVSSADAFAPVGQRDFSWFSAVCYLFGRDVYRELGGKVPIGLVASDWGGQAIQVFSSPDALNDTTCGGTIPLDSASPRGSSAQFAAGSEVNPSASQLWFGMLAPFSRMRFAGAVWYQGEDNCWAPHQYSCLFPAMITDWRSKFDLPDMSFFFVQLAPYWPRRDFTAVRNAQMAALKLPKVGYAVAIDLGDVHSPVTPIHPRRKQEVGRRLALSALSVQYGRHDIVSTGPVFASVATDYAAQTATVSYANGTAHSLHSAGTADCELVGSKLCCGESPFQVLTTTGQWQRVNFSLSVEHAVLSLATAPPGVVVAKPLAVRYAWEAWPQCSLYNGVGGPDNHTGIAATPFCWNRTAPCAY